MIFVTVGTHEQPFDRLLGEVGRLAVAGELPDEVFCQRGSTSVHPALAGAPMISHSEMQRHIEAASVVVSHGGPGSVLAVLAAGRPLVLVPRQHRYGEHVDDHQVAFCRRVGRDRGVPVVEDVGDLAAAILAAHAAGPTMASTPLREPAGVARLGELVDGLLRAR